MKSLCQRLLLLFFCAISISAATEVVKIQGEVAVSLDRGKTWASLKPGNIPGGASIKTGKDSFADVRFVGGSSMRLSPESVVEIDKDEVSKEETLVRLSLSKGRLIASAVGNSESSRFEVKGLRGVCGTRGEKCAFDMTADGFYRCFTGTLIFVDVILGIVPSVTLTSGYESPPSEHRRENPRRMSDDDHKKLGVEIEAMEKSASGESK